MPDCILMKPETGERETVALTNNRCLKQYTLNQEIPESQRNWKILSDERTHELSAPKLTGCSKTYIVRIHIKQEWGGAQTVRCLLHKGEDQSWDSQHPHRYKCEMVCLQV